MGITMVRGIEYCSLHKSEAARVLVHASEVGVSETTWLLAVHVNFVGSSLLVENL